MNKLKTIGSIAFVLFVIDPLGYLLWNEGIAVKNINNFNFAYAYEFNLWKYKIIYNPVVEEEIISTFPETHVFDKYVGEYNKQEKINSIMARLGYGRIGIINTDSNFIYTIYLENGKIIKVADGFDNVDFIAELSIARIESLLKQDRFEDLPKEVKVPLKVKLKILKILWF